MSQPPIRVGCQAICVDVSYYADTNDVEQGNHGSEGWVFTNSVWVPTDNSRPRRLRLEVHGRFRPHPRSEDQRQVVKTLLGWVELPSWDAARLYDVRDDPTTGKMNMDLPPELRR